MVKFSPEQKFVKGASEKGDIIDIEGKTDEEIMEELMALLKKYQEKAQGTIDAYRNFLHTFAKDTSLDFKLSKRFAINNETGEVNLDIRWFFERGFTKNQIIWALLHEVMHFRDMIEDLEGYDDRSMHEFRQSRRIGKIILEKIEDAFEDEDPSKVDLVKQEFQISRKHPEVKLNRAEIAGLQIIHTFNNSLDDIWDNDQVSRRARKYARGTSAGEEITDLYREVLFKGVDYSHLPRHLQYQYALLRKEMVPDEEVIVSDDVQEALDREIKFKGKKYTSTEIVNTFIKHKPGRDNSIGERSKVITKTLEPIFIDLLHKDLEEWDPKKQAEQEEREAAEQEQEPSLFPEEGEGDEEPEEPQEGEGEDTPEEGDANPFKKEYDDQKENSIDQLDNEDREDFVDKVKEQQEEEDKAKEEERGKSAEQKALELQEQADREFAEEQNMDYETIKKFRELERAVRPFLDYLSKMWRHIIAGKTKETRRGIEGHFKTGTELDIDKVIHEFPDLMSGDFEKVRPMKRVVERKIEIKKPELIRVRLSCDLSSSMDADKLLVMHQATVLLLQSLDEFNTYLNMTRARTKSKLRVDTEVWKFNDKDSHKRVKEFGQGKSRAHDKKNVFKTWETLKSPTGWTYDDGVMSDVLESLSKQDGENIKNGKLLEIFIEITDGGSSHSSAARENLDKMIDAGIIVLAFQIGKVSDDDEVLFNEVWNDGREDQRGFVVGEEIENLLPAIVYGLRKYLENVKL